ncbi:MAG: response regulator [Pseudomonadota bacterium]
MTVEPRKTRILVVDDDAKVRTLLRRCFEPEGYLVSEAATGAEAHAELAAENYDLITLDLNLGAEDGLTLAREIRADSDVPIIMVTGKGDLIDTVVGLEVGADDYISKPFHVREVLARVRSVLRRAESKAALRENREQPADPGSQTYCFDRWQVDFQRLDMRDSDNVKNTLTTGEFSLLEVFVNNPGRVMTRNVLMDNLRGQDWAANDRSIDNQIARLRKKIERDPAQPELIKTVRGAGYTFTAKVDKRV